MRILTKKITKMSLFAAIFSFTLFAVSLNANATVNAAEEDVPTQSSSSYNYTATSGDSYTKLARMSILEYDKSNDEVLLDAAEVTAAETYLTQDAGSPYLEINQKVEISKDKVAQFVKQATELSDSSKKAWQRYANKSDVLNTAESNSSSNQNNDADEAQNQEQSNEQPAEAGDNEDPANKQDEQSNEQPAGEDGTEDQQEAGENSQDVDDEDKSSRKWLILAVIVLLILAAITLIRSSGKEKEE